MNTRNHFTRWRHRMPAPLREPKRPGRLLPYPSQREAARMLGVAPATVASWESGRRLTPEPVRRLMAALASVGRVPR